MTVLVVPFHLDERLAPPPVPGTAVAPDLPAGGSPARVLELSRVVAARVAAAVTATGQAGVAAGDCVAALGVVAGLQSAGIDPAVVWLDAHGDYNTPATSPSGYLGGMPLAMLAGRDDLGLTAGLGLRPVAADRIVLAGARDLDPGEVDLLAADGVPQVPVPALGTGPLPPGPLYLHVDVDVIDAGELPGLRYPAAGGPDSAAVGAAVRRVLATGRVAAWTLACTWRPGTRSQAEGVALAARLGLPLPGRPGAQAH